MCTFNTLVLPTTVRLAVVNEIAESVLHLTFVDQGNPSIEHAFGDDARSFVRAGGDCDCGAGLASARRPQEVAATDRELDKRRAAGWSPAKLARWQAQRGETQTRRDDAFTRRHGHPPVVAATWAALVERLLEPRLAAWVGLFTHEYRGAVATERIAIGDLRRLAVRRGEVEARIGELEEDHPIAFTRDGSWA
ncbi:MAG: hypothetical protein NT062_27750 [Proteobacteria bacterium]|nr:hypothetical protein [Pseudomonadota bacterium]